jgi:hypothetical protein
MSTINIVQKENDEEVVVQATFMNKPSIDMNGLNILQQSMMNHTIFLNNPLDLTNYLNLKLIAEIVMMNKVNDITYGKFIWKYDEGMDTISKSELLSVNFPNNLETCIDDVMKTAMMPFLIINSLLESIRVHFHCEHLVMHEVNETRLRVYLKFD